MNSLMLTAVAQFLPTSYYQSLLCCAGSMGYGAFKELLLSGIPGCALMVEGCHDLRELVAGTDNSQDFYHWIYNSTSFERYGGCARPPAHNTMLVYTNMTDLPPYCLEGWKLAHTIILKKITSHQQFTELPMAFLANCSHVTSVDISPSVNNVTTLQPGFLSGCIHLESIDLTPLSSVIEIHMNFMYGCTKITSVDLAPFARVRKLSEGFLSGCDSLRTVDLTPLVLLTELPPAFLKKSGVTSFNMRPLANFQNLPPQFLAFCSRLEMLDMSPMMSLQRIPPVFLYECTALKYIDLRPFSNVQVGGLDQINRMLVGCRGLERVIPIFSEDGVPILLGRIHPPHTLPVDMSDNKFSKLCLGLPSPSGVRIGNLTHAEVVLQLLEEKESSHREALNDGDCHEQVNDDFVSSRRRRGCIIA